MYLHNFQKDVLHRNIIRFYDDEFLAVQKSVLELRDKYIVVLYYQHTIFSNVLVEVQKNQSFMLVPCGKRPHCGCSCGEDLRPRQQKSHTISSRDSRVLDISSKSS
jgi:hypothetical protein